MSSNHTRVSAREWAELRQRIGAAEAFVIRNDREVRRLQQEAERRSREIARTHAANMQAIRQATETMIRAYETNLQQVRGQLRQQLTQQQADFRGQLDQLLTEVQDLSYRLSSADTRVEALAQQYSQAFQAILDQKTQGKERAEAVLQQLDQLLEQIRLLKPEQFMPGDYAALQALRASVAANVEAGDYQAATLVSQSSILTASRVLTQLTLINERYNRQLEAVRNEAAAVAGRMDALASEAGELAVEVSGEEQTYEYDIGYWSDGGFARLQQQLAEAEARLASGTLSLQELEQVSGQVAQLQAALERCDLEARNAMAESVFVEDTAVRLHNSLTERGWELVDGGHHADEAREPYTLEYADGNGNTVSVVVSPGERAEEPIYAIEVYAEDEYRGAIIKEGIHSAMEQEGLQITGIERRNDCHLNPDPEAFRSNMVREAQQRQRNRRRQTM